MHNFMNYGLNILLKLKIVLKRIGVKERCIDFNESK